MKTARLVSVFFALAFPMLAGAVSAAERLLFDGEVTLAGKETAFQPQFSDLTAPEDFRPGSLFVRYEVQSMAAAGPTVALQCCLKAPDDAHTCVTCVSITKPGTYTIDRPLAKMFKSAPIPYDQLTRLVLVAKAEKCSNHDEPPEPLKAQYYPLKLRATVVAVPAGATFSGWDNYRGPAPAAVALAPAAPARTLDLYWVDVEGGAATLIVTPAGESILIDSGSPGGRDSSRIQQTATKEAGLAKIDHFILTHFHSDHFGGAAEVAELMPIGEVYDNGHSDYPSGIQKKNPAINANDPRWALTIGPYRKFKADNRHVMEPGQVIPLRQTPGGPAISLRCLAVNQKFSDLPAGATPNPLCAEAVTKPVDTTDNANSIVLVLDYGPFRFFAGGDLTWNTEGELVCPVNRAGQVDVYQVDHHGLDVSNNPVLIHSLVPTVAIMSNGPRKGANPPALEALKSSPGLRAIYQIHKNLDANALPYPADEFIANLAAKDCPGNFIRLSVAPDAQSYTVTVPSTGHRQVYQTRTK